MSLLPRDFNDTDQERWFDGNAQCVDGYLFCHEWIGDQFSETFNCTAFDVDIGCNAGNDPIILVRFVSIPNLLRKIAVADATARIKYSDVISNPVAVLTELARCGFYVAPETTCNHIAGAVRDAIDFGLFHIRMNPQSEVMPSPPLGISIH